MLLQATLSLSTVTEMDLCTSYSIEQQHIDQEGKNNEYITIS
jgi:hypothetical protein